ncbi:MAG: YlxR family protein [Candidatus Eremiobacteraeota bacterium]|nr:YlxR family protein [Candidatus Eremiobacteraeota bacterium]
MEPVRTCVGCRRRFAQRELARFVRAAAGWRLDIANRRRQPGRGAYLCSARCAQAALKNRRYPGLGAAAAEYGLIECLARSERND